MTDEQTNKGDTGGKETDTSNKENKKPIETNNETISELDRADQIAERQKRENDRREELLKREESLEARKAVGGVTSAGQNKKEPEVISDSDYADKFKRGEVDPLGEDGISINS